MTFEKNPIIKSGADVVSAAFTRHVVETPQTNALHFH